MGATCNVQFEADAGLLQNLDAFHRQVRNPYVAAAQTVNDELARQQVRASSISAAGRSVIQPAQASLPPSGNGNNGHEKRSHGPSEKQMTFLRQLADQIRGLGVRQLDTLAQRMFRKPVAGLSSHDVSWLIDTLTSRSQNCTTGVAKYIIKRRECLATCHPPRRLPWDHSRYRARARPTNCLSRGPGATCFVGPAGASDPEEVNRRSRGFPGEPNRLLEA